MWVLWKSNNKEYVNNYCFTYKINLNVKIDFAPFLITQWRNCYAKYYNDLHYIDKRMINVANMKFSNFCVHSIKN